MRCGLQLQTLQVALFHLSANTRNAKVQRVQYRVSMAQDKQVAIYLVVQLARPSGMCAKQMYGNNGRPKVAMATASWRKYTCENLRTQPAHLHLSPIWINGQSWGPLLGLISSRRNSLLMHSMAGVRLLGAA
jgi:hypothetical protein